MLSSLPSALTATLLSCWVMSASASCPHEDATLRAASDASGWPGSVLPAAGDSLVITDAVLWDIASDDLADVTIAAGGKIVFDPTAELAKIAAGAVVVSGELWIGSETCPFQGQAEIELLGKKGEAPGVTVNGATHYKVLLVPDGRLEVHGAPRLAWTRLTATVPKTTREILIGSPIFDHRTSDSYHSGHRGFIAHEFTADGQHVQSLGLLRKVSQFQALAAKTGNVILIVVQREVQWAGGHDNVAMAEALEAACYSSDGRQSAIRGFSRSERTAWAAVCHVGTPENSFEMTGALDVEEGYSMTERTVKQIGSTEFVVFSRVNTAVSWDFTADMLSYAAGTIPPPTLTLELEDDVSGWQAGERVAITSTDYRTDQVEEFVLVDCGGECSSNQVKILNAVEFTHWGETTDGVRQAAEVALLDRNVRIHGRMEDACYGNNKCDKLDFDSWGGHIKMLADFQAANVENAEIFNMGQNSVLGSYPVHYHMCGDVEARGAYVRGNAIHHNFARCVTVHGTHNLLVEGNVGYDTLGHCFFLEDGGEQNTVFRGNLGFNTRETDITSSDHNCATFWITNPLTTLEGNVAGGSEGYGFHYTFPRRPIGPSADVSDMVHNQAYRTPLAPFENNVAHSNKHYGLRMDGVLSENGRIVWGFNYDPREDPLDENSPRVSITMRGYTGFKNYKSVWMRAASVTLENFSTAESVEGVVFAYSAPGTKRLVDSRIVGETENKGKPAGRIALLNGTRIYWDRSIRMGGNDRALPIIGVIAFEGPISLERVSFARFETNVVRPAGGLGFRRKNDWYTQALHRVSGLTFDYTDPTEGNRVFESSDSRGYEDKPGTIHTVVRDVDGSLTTYPGSTIVKPYPIHLNARCAEVPNWNLYVCPAKFTKFRWLWDSLSADPTTFLTRNDGLTHTMEGQRQISYALNSQESYILHFSTTMPARFFFTVTGLEAGVEQRLGVCVGRDAVNLRVTIADVSVPAVDQLEDALTTSYYHDRERGLLLFRFVNAYAVDAQTEGECPGWGPYGACPEVVIAQEEDSADGDCSSRAYPTYSTTPLDTTGALTTPVFT